MAKLVASDAAMKVTTDAVQVLGGYGYTRDFPVERYMREAKITQIFEGTNQIQRLVIARALAAAVPAGHFPPQPLPAPDPTRRPQTSHQIPTLDSTWSRVGLAPSPEPSCW